MYNLTMFSSDKDKFKEEVKERIALSEALTRLLNNSDFKLFMTNYCEKEAIRIAECYGEPSFNGSTDKTNLREDMQERLIGIGRFLEYIRYVMLIGNKVKQEQEEFNELNLNFLEE